MSINELVRQTETFTRWIKGGIKSLEQNLDDSGDYASTTLIEDDEFSYHYIVENYLIIEPDSNAFSIEVKDNGDGRTKLRLLIDGPFINLENNSCIFDIEELTASESCGNIQQMPEGWVRCSIFTETTRYSPFNLHIMLVNDSGEYDYKGDNTSGITIRVPVGKEFPPTPTDDIYVIFGIDYVDMGDDSVIFND